MVLAHKARIYKTFIKFPDIVTYIGLIFLLLPLWWVLGIEQFILPVMVFILLLLKILYMSFTNQTEIKSPTIIKVLIGFLFIYGISGFFIVESYRYLLFFYQYINYISVSLLFFFIINQVSQKKDLIKISWIFFSVLTLSSIVGFFGIIGCFTPKFPALVKDLLPEFIRESDFLFSSLNKSIVKEDAQIWHFNYNRVSSFFMYASNYAQVLVAVIPITFFLFYYVKTRGSKLFFKNILIFSIVLMICNLIFTAARTAIIGFLIGGFWWIFFWKKLHLKSKNYFMVFIIVILLLVFILIIILPYFNVIIYDARVGSFRDRWIVYEKTFESLKDRIFLGWGVSRAFKDVYPEMGLVQRFPPLGSHGTYLGVLYKQGMIGLSVFFLFLWSIGRHIRQSYKAKNIEPELFNFIGFASWGFIATTIQGIFNMLDLDSFSFHITWLNWSLIIAASYMVKQNILKKEGYV